MKRPLLLITIAVVGFLLAFSANPTSIFAQSDFNAYLGKAIPDNQIDGIVADEWNDAANYSGVAISPRGNAQIWTKHDQTYLYIAVVFTADSSNPWIALLLGGNSCMVPDADGALFGHDDYAPNGYQDISFAGFKEILVDNSQDGKGALNIDPQNTITVELKKPLNSNDSAGKDIAWTKDQAYSLIVMWNSKFYGASGGNVTHSDGPFMQKTIFINSNIIPEFPTFILVAVLVAATTSALLISKKTRNRFTSN